ncbi:PEP-utilizing enzyme [Kitasatospora sp. NBC_00240]|uniref:PEP/pyruvate-binding domain-containing protein n=1 Tax=Kitasatospora sp. NBC_00240 TaxID=2903567 RepID=UPI002255D71D|nr:PEP/pyruvate-binding domain-containing protein [Kitasatospora sp. NBC_00240]MCX5215791.1 PEP-utilizing enzyme [Kitasatospora sp. NBC_00240]
MTTMRVAALPSAADCAAEAVGNKFAALNAAAAAGSADIPPACCVPVDWFTEALGTDRLRRLPTLFTDLTTTVGHDLVGAQRELASILDGLALTPRMRTIVAGFVAQLDGPVAVRSSTTVEDGPASSHAGLYNSFLHLSTLADVEQAILACWRSFYALPAVLGRLRAHDSDPTPRMAVIIQAMADARLSGIAFTQPGGTVTVEAVSGTAEHLADGAEAGTTVDVAPHSTAPEPYHSVAALARSLKALFRGDVDIEWAWDGSTTQLLQVRPLTAHLHRAQPTGPVCASASLYFTDTLPAGLVLGDLADVYLAITAKRSRPYRMARAADVAVRDGWILSINGAALTDPALRPAWLTDLAGDVVVDLGRDLRQNILPAAALLDFLTAAWGTATDPLTVHAVIVRPFVRGLVGAVAHRLEDGTTVIDHSSDGLLDINRGMAGVEQILCPPTTDEHAWNTLEPPAPWTARTLQTVAAFTGVLDADMPGVYSEWVLTPDGPQFVDHTEPGADHDTVVPTAGHVLSPGAATGPLLRISDSDDLTRFTVAPLVSMRSVADAPASDYVSGLITVVRAMPGKPVVYARRPYAILSVLLDDVAGMVFEGGSRLCHLAILLREAGIPAAVLGTPLPDEATVAVLDDGTVHTR